jgi:integrase
MMKVCSCRRRKLRLKVTGGFLSGVSRIRPRPELPHLWAWSRENDRLGVPTVRSRSNARPESRPGAASRESVIRRSQWCACVAVGRRRQLRCTCDGDDVDVEAASCAWRATGRAPLQQRWLPLTARLAEALREHLAAFRFSGSPWVFHHRAVHGKRKKDQRQQSAAL